MFYFVHIPRITYSSHLLMATGTSNSISTFHSPDLYVPTYDTVFPVTLLGKSHIIAASHSLVVVVFSPP